MASGRQDQIENGATGVLVDPSDLAAFGSAVVSLLRDPTGAAELGARARARVREKFIPPRHLAQYVDLFARLVSGGTT